MMDDSTGTVLDPKTAKAKYPEVRVIKVSDDNFNTFQHVAIVFWLLSQEWVKKKDRGILQSK